MFLAAETLTASSTVGLTVGQLFAILGSIIGSAALGAWWLSGRFALLATRDDLKSLDNKLDARTQPLATKEDLKSLENRLQSTDTKVQGIAIDVAVLKALSERRVEDSPLRAKASGA
ncbi:MAG TPA: hypothetical protein VKP30_30595 [Polyangiaceae bacterium]|nr:hypothetical protein [Polyangiaceae bacterium]